MNSISRTVFWMKIFLIFIFAILLSCSPKSSDTIRIGILDGPSAVSFIQLIDNPPLIEGKQVQFIIKSEPLQIQALMMRGELDFAILPTVMAANLYNKGVKYRMVACPIWGTLYLMTNTSARNFMDLKGQVVSVIGQGATPDILLQHVLKDKGVDGVKIDYTYSTNSELAQALRFGQVKVAVISEPLVSSLLVQDAKMHIVSKLNCEEYMDNTDKDIFVQTSFLASSRFIEENPELVTLVCDAYSNSCNFISDQPVKAAELLVKYQFLPSLSIAKISLPLCNIRYVGAFALEREVNRYLHIFLEYNPESIGGKLPPNDFIFQTY